MAPKANASLSLVVLLVAVLMPSVVRTGMAQDADDSSDGRGSASSDRENSARKAPVPPAIEREEASKAVRRVYRSKLSKKGADDRSKVAKELISEAKKKAITEAERYAILTEARMVAAKAADVVTAIEAVEALDNSFRVDRLALLEETLGSVGRPRGLVAAVEFHRAWTELVESSIEREQYETAARLAKAAHKAVRKTRDKVLTRDAKDLEEFAVSLEKEFEKIQPFVSRLIDSPDDAEAQRQVAIFLCLHKRDWEAGLPAATKDPSTPLGEVAEQDLANPRASLELVNVGTAWHELASEYKGVPRISCFIRAVKWLEAAMAGLPALSKEDVSKRLAKIYKEAPSLRPVVGIDRFQVMTLDRSYRYKVQSLDKMTVARSGDALSFKNTTGSKGRPGASQGALLAETTKLNGDFEATLELYGGKAIGLVSASGYYAKREFPVGKSWQRVRIARVDGKVECQINGRDVAPDKGNRWSRPAPEDMSSNLCINLAPGQECRIRNFLLRADLDAPESASELDSFLERLRRGGRGGRGDDDDDDDDGNTGRGRNGRGGRGGGRGR